MPQYAKRDTKRPFTSIRPKNDSASLSQLVDVFQAEGKYVFLRDEVLPHLRCSKEALKKAIERLVAKSRLVVPRRGFYVIVPHEYQHAKSPPPTWFIDDLMKFHNCSYYVGLLSAAAIHGAGHQQPQEFQVITSRQLRPTQVGRARIRFFTKSKLETTPKESVKTDTGSMLVSTPEATALDLVRYLESAGHLNHVATVMSELHGRLEPNKLIAAAREESELAHIQRLGFLLDYVEASPDLTDPLAHWIAGQNPSQTVLRADKEARKAPLNSKWRVSVNEEIEVDEV